VNRNASCNPLLHVSHHASGHFGVGGCVQIIVVDVELGIWIRRMGCVEGNRDKVLTQHVGEDGAAQRAILVENFVYDVLWCIQSKLICKVELVGTHPCTDLSRITTNEGTDVILED
jgi:hypothetical protein